MMTIYSLLCATVLHVVVGHDHYPGEHLGHLADALAGSGGYLAGSGQMVVQSLAAGMAVNMQWFQPSTATGPSVSVSIIHRTTSTNVKCSSVTLYIQTPQPVKLNHPLLWYNLVGHWPLILEPYPPYVGEEGG